MGQLINFQVSKCLLLIKISEHFCTFDFAFEIVSYSPKQVM